MAWNLKLDVQTMIIGGDIKYCLLVNCCRIRNEELSINAVLNFDDRLVLITTSSCDVTMYSNEVDTPAMVTTWWSPSTCHYFKLWRHNVLERGRYTCNGHYLVIAKYLSLLQVVTSTRPCSSGINYCALRFLHCWHNYWNLSHCRQLGIVMITVTLLVTWHSDDNCHIVGNLA